MDDAATWQSAAPGFEKALFPILPDDGKVFSLYSASFYDLFLIDTKGRVATRYRDFIGNAQVSSIAARIRQLAQE